jgi:hypothetical protein
MSNLATPSMEKLVIIKIKPPGTLIVHQSSLVVRFFGLIIEGAFPEHHGRFHFSP